MLISALSLSIAAKTEYHLRLLLIAAGPRLDEGASVSEMDETASYPSEREREFCERLGFPLSTESPLARLRALGALRNRSHLFQGLCARSGKRVLSQFPSSSGLTVYDVDVWESDGWSGQDYGRPYDFSRPFFEQLHDLFRIVPLPNLAVIRSTMENSDYANGITGGKNLYLVFGASYNHDCYFSRMINNCRDCVDCIMTNSSELCFECRNVHSCYNLRYAEDCHNCTDSAFMHGCFGCKNCFGCVNLRQAEYHYFNKKLTREEYFAALARIDLGSRAVVAQYSRQFSKLVEGAPRKFFSGMRADGCSGNFLNGTKQVSDSYFLTECEDCENCIWLKDAKDSHYYWSFGNGSQLVYNCISCGDGVYNLRCCVDCWPGAHDLEYCIYTGYNSSDCFGCVGLKHAHHCILNRQYDKDEYLDLRRRIIEAMRVRGEYGQFFPRIFNPFPYNVSEANEFFPLSREQALAQGFTWHEEPPPEPAEHAPIPDNIADVDEAIVARTFHCKGSARPYRIIKPELDFYRRQRIPPPEYAPMERLRGRTSILRHTPLLSAPCANCGTELRSCYSSGPRPVLCEPCFEGCVSR